MPAVPTLDRKPLYALAGAGDAAVNALRTRVVALPSLVAVLPGQVKGLRAQIHQQVIDLAGKAEHAYDAFAAQGAKTVAARRGETVTTAATKPATKPAAKPAAKRSTKPAATKPAATRTPVTAAAPSTTAGLPESPAATTPAATTPAAEAATQPTLNGSTSV